ncbi:MAG: outer membrane beta-barrel protein [Dysgonamonadaceae bacterium]|jgi:hypothetical protein|nr:outer membrane beta-barrel protein [Dysgonamonadaceae bacterium]
MKKINCICFLLFFCYTAFAQGNLTGRVLNSKGEPIVGALVIVNETANQSITDLDGYYFLRNIALNTSIEATYIGCDKKRFKYNGQDTLNIVLKNSSRFKWGLTQGLGLSNFTDSYDYGKEDGLSPTPSTKFSFVFEFPLKNQFFIVPEIGYTIGGCFYKSIIYDGTINTFYLQIPVNFMYKLKLSNKVDFEIFTGLYAGYLLGLDLIIYDDEIYDNDISKLHKGGCNNWDYGANIGIGIAGKHFFGKIQYNRGFASVLKHPESYSGNYKITNKNIGLSFGYMF